TAVMVHPDDERYRHLIGKTVTLPLTGRLIPVIADDYVDREFGTGVVKVTPAHDFNDYAVGQRHGLPLINILADDASVRHEAPRIDIEVREHQFDGEGRFQPSSFASWPVQSTEKLPDRYAGLDRYEARKVVLADLEAAGLLVETKPHKLQVPRGDRTGQVIEPYLTDQWFVKMDGLAARGMQLVENGDVKFVPANWINTYRHWMENIQDWCISRQLWWGHRIPAWYDARNRVYVGRSRDDAQLEFEASLAAIRNTLPGSRLAKGDASSGEGIARLQKELEFLQSNGLKQDNDVLETWFSAQLWPISTMGWPNQTLMDTRGFDKYVPSSVLVTGFDIIFFWVARMIMATDHFMPQDRADAERVPFRHVYITGLVRDKDGQKMSKSKGNILDPLDLIDGISLDDLVAKRTAGLMQPEMAGKIEKATRREFPEGIPAFGADALRFTIAALATHGRDIRFDMGRAEGYKNFCNKLWNATRFVLMNTDGYHASGTPQPATDAEKWILSRLAKVSAEAETHFASYRFDLLAQALYEFAWNEFCDWFVEFSKSALQPKVNLQTGEELLRIKKRQAEVAQSVRHTLLYVLEALLRLLHPLIPFVSEELWRSVAPKLGIDGDTISLQIYPRASDFATQGFAQAETDIEWLKAMVSALRRVRSELGVSPTNGIRLLISGDDSLARSRIEKFQGELRMMARLDLLTETNDWWLASGVEPPPAATAIVGDLKLFVPLEGLVDLDAERTRLDKELKRVEGELAKSQGKLASETFVQNAPAAVVEQERQRLADWGAQRDALAMQRAKLS
ncbi:MAG: valine--tRNA ligase, partial [Luteimonas sp.]